MNNNDNLAFDLLFNSLLSVEKWVSKENYIGWDPYDGINNSMFPTINLFYPYPQIALIQFNKYSPFNFRKLLSIKKELDPKGIALFVQAYTIIFQNSNKEIYKHKAMNLFNELMKCSLFSTWGNHCWSSHRYPFIGVDKDKLSPHFPDIIGTANALKAIALLYLLDNRKDLKDIIKSIHSFFKSMYECTSDLSYFLYTPFSKGKIVPNASAEALEALILSIDVHRDPEILKICENTLKSLQTMQRENGSWFYSIYPSGKRYQQLDFHQGYLIDGLISSTSLYFSINNQDLKYSIIKATEFYKGMFASDGRSFYRYPKFLPTDIHNQAQGIITFCKLYNIYKDEYYLDFAMKIAKWTVVNMQDSKGYYYHQKGHIVTNKIPYMRWGQAWMLLALAILIDSILKYRHDS